MGNSILNKAKYSTNTDEWYTDYSVVEKELTHYETQFKNKKILCNCDDPYESAFSKYFLKNFNKLKLNKLICISYGKSLMHKEENDNGLILIVEQIPNNKHETLTDNEILNFLKKTKGVKKLKGDGDFRSEECIKYLEDTDIVVTNPPFSKFIELFLLITKYNKKYLLIGNQNAIMYKEIFPYIKNNLAYVGYHLGDMSFKVPSSTKPRKTRFWIDEEGQKWRSLGNVMWLTNLKVKKDRKKLLLNCIYDKTVYPKYDNFDAIHIDRVAKIPMDYYGIMGVPLTYLKYHNDMDFEIIGEANHGSDNEYDLFKPQVNGKNMYKRILIRKKRN